MAPSSVAGGDASCPTRLTLSHDIGIGNVSCEYSTFNDLSKSKKRGGHGNIVTAIFAGAGAANGCAQMSVLVSHQDIPGHCHGMVLSDALAVVMFRQWILFVDQRRVRDTTVVDVMDQCGKDDRLAIDKNDVVSCVNWTTSINHNSKCL
jgi:hypothetical protein